MNKLKKKLPTASAQSAGPIASRTMMIARAVAAEGSAVDHRMTKVTDTQTRVVQVTKASADRPSIGFPVAPLVTTEQYWALLLTTALSRFSMNSRDTCPHGFGRQLNVSNL